MFSRSSVNKFGTGEQEKQEKQEKQKATKVYFT